MILSGFLILFDCIFISKPRPCGAIREGADNLECYSAHLVVGSIPGRDLRERNFGGVQKIILKSGVGEMITPAPVP